MPWPCCALQESSRGLLLQLPPAAGLPSLQSLLPSLLPPPHRCYVFGPENREALAHKAGTYCAKLLKRTDQCLAVLSCSHLYWQAPAEVGGIAIAVRAGALCIFAGPAAWRRSGAAPASACSA